MKCIEIQHSCNYSNSKYRYIQNIIFSELRMINHGVPQGSILGLLLFLCHVKGLPSVIPGGGSISLFVDHANMTILLVKNIKV